MVMMRGGETRTERDITSGRDIKPYWRQGFKGACGAWQGQGASSVWGEHAPRAAANWNVEAIAADRSATSRRPSAAPAPSGPH